MQLLFGIEGRAYVLLFEAHRLFEFRGIFSVRLLLYFQLDFLQDNWLLTYTVDRRAD